MDLSIFFIQVHSPFSEVGLFLINFCRLGGNLNRQTKGNIMTQAQNGNTVKIHYTGKLENGEVFDSSEGHEPLEFTIGKGQMIPGFEAAVIGMETGEAKKAAKIPADQAYAYYEELVVEIPRDQFPEYITPEIGQQLQAQQQDGQIMVVKVVDFNDTTVTLDGNHPLAGQDLYFDLEVVEVS
jgi:peptidylprolyl isomerase